jgi:methionine-rich copper-binding protein CopC
MRKLLLLKPALLWAAALATAAVAGEAAAHARLVKSDPKAGAAVAPPKTLKLWFSETVVPAQSKVAISGPAGPVATGKLAVDPKNPRLVSVPVTAALAPGAYKVNWTMKSEDTHVMEGSFAFKVR